MGQATQREKPFQSENHAPFHALILRGKTATQRRPNRGAVVFQSPSLLFLDDSSLLDGRVMVHFVPHEVF